jgi:hypothetical protein
MPQAGFEPAIKRLQTYNVDRVATVIGLSIVKGNNV